MILKFRAEDLISIILAEETFQHSQPIEIEYSRVNRMRGKLRSRGVSSDLGIRELETMCFDYPKDIHIESKSLILYKNTGFIQHFQLRMSKYKADDMKLIKDLWEESK